MAKEKKVGVFRWRGVMSDLDRVQRIVVFVTLVSACVSLAFTQLGFLSIPLPDHGTVYVVTMLLPVAIAALMLGTVDGGLVGLIAGATLYLHSRVLPLDVYEMVFVNGYSSVVYMTLMGLLLGIAFALALRKNPSNGKRAVRIVVICLVFSWLYSIGFATNAVVVTVNSFALDGVASAGSNEEIVAALANQLGMLDVRYGSVDWQAWIDGALMALACVFCDAAFRLIIARREDVGMRAVFNGSLLLVVANVFFLVSAVTFVGITQLERLEAFDKMKGNVEYLRVQINNNDKRTEALDEYVRYHGLDPFSIDPVDIKFFIEATSALGFMDGYSLETDGIVFESAGGMILMANLPAVMMDESPMLDDEVDEALIKSVETGEVETIIFDGTLRALESDEADTNARADIAYIYGEQADNGYIEGTIVTSDLVYADRMGVMASTTLSTMLLLLAVIGLVVFLLNRMVLRRIDETNGVLERITNGDLDARVEVRDTRELASLSNGINTTVDAMKDLIAEAETRMDAELATAKAIQESALPRTFPPYPDILSFDIYAGMNPAKQVGGDFYDFFLIGDEANPSAGKLGFVVADVSGKGVPAALFMMEAKSQIRRYVSSGMELGEALENANRQLCEGNDAGMFVTAWVGVLDYATGHIDYVNAGHNPPLMWAFDAADEVGGEQGALGGGWRWLTEKSGLPLGLFDGLPYQAHVLDCLPGDQLLLYSDGVTEAMSASEELYGEPRLEELANKYPAAHPQELVEAVRADVAAHAEGAEQSDDITILSLEVGVPPEMTVAITVPAEIPHLLEVNDFIHAELDRRLCPKRVQNLLDVAVEELFVNVCRYAYPDATIENPGTVRVSCAYTAEPQSVTIQLSDDGIPFDPLAKPDAVTPEDIFDVPIGGLGILMTKRSVDEMDYVRSGNSNIVSIMKKW